MSLTQRIANAVQNLMRTRRPRPGRLIVPREDDRFRDYPSSGLTPSRLMALLREADAGVLDAAMQLFEEMEEKDAHLYAVANTRRLAITGLEWSIVSAADVDRAAERNAADEAAEYCRSVLAGLEGFDLALQHLGLALGRNIAVAELVWDLVDGRPQLIDIVPVDFTRLAFDRLDRVRILTAEEPVNGIELPPNKFVVHTPQATSGHAARGGLLRVTAMIYLAKNLALKDWMIFSEVFGMPVRIARYDPGATADEKRELLDMLKNMGSNAAGIFSRAVDLEIVEANRGTIGPPYEKLIDFLNREMSKAWLGQTLTTDVAGVSGTLTASRVHEEVRKDLRADDLRREAFTIRRDILAPLARLQFGPDVPVPHFRRRLGRPADANQFAELLGTAVNQLGVELPRKWVHETLGIPMPAPGEPVVGAVSDRDAGAQGSGLNAGLGIEELRD